MSLSFKILGKSGKDNALLINVESGTRIVKLLIDCGEGIFDGVTQHEVKTIDHIFFSHFHFDHAAGFDYFFRRNYYRDKPVNVWGPAGTSKFIFNKLNSYTWNLVDGLTGLWNIYEFDEYQIKPFRILASEGFSKLHEDELFNRGLLIFEDEYFTVSSVLLDHRINSAAYRISEKSKYNIDIYELESLNIPAGPWLETVRDINRYGEIEIHGKKFNLDILRKDLLTETKGESVTYMTDFIFSEENFAKCVEIAAGSDVLICESQYLVRDKELAGTNYHLITKQAAEIAKQAGCKKLYLFHLSERYSKDELNLFTEEARTVFAETYLPESWII